MRQPDWDQERDNEQTRSSLLAALGVTAMHLADYAPPLQPIASEDALQPFPSQDFSHIRLTEPALGAAICLIESAANDNVRLYPISGFRSLDYQAELIQRKLQHGTALETIMRVNALPGYSEHHTGEALDLGTSAETDLETPFEETRAFEWLAKHAHEFRFTLSYPRDHAHGFIYEPWHWRYKP